MAHCCQFYLLRGRHLFLGKQDTKSASHHQPNISLDASCVASLNKSSGELVGHFCKDAMRDALDVKHGVEPTIRCLHLKPTRKVTFKICGVRRCIIATCLTSLSRRCVTAQVNANNSQGCKAQRNNLGGRETNTSAFYCTFPLDFNSDLMLPQLPLQSSVIIERLSSYLHSQR